VLKPKHPHELTKKHRLDALQYLTFFKGKLYSAKIKGRGCANSRTQRLNMQKEDTISPTVAVKSLFISVTLDARGSPDEGNYITGAFM